jgi:hypothetical protein
MTGLQMDVLSETAGTCFSVTRKVMSVLHQLYLNVSYWCYTREIELFSDSNLYTPTTKFKLVYCTGMLISP